MITPSKIDSLLGNSITESKEVRVLRAKSFQQLSRFRLDILYEISNFLLRYGFNSDFTVDTYSGGTYLTILNSTDIEPIVDAFLDEGYDIMERYSSGNPYFAFNGPSYIIYQKNRYHPVLHNILKNTNEAAELGISFLIFDGHND